MRAKRIYLAFSVLLIAILACNLPGGQTSTPDLAATITAQALTLQVPTGTPPPAFTDTPSSVEASVTSPTNCRTGPSSAYDLVFTANTGQSFEVIGKNTSTNYWIITNPTGGSCWLWGQNTTVTGDTSSLPEYPVPDAPPTHTPKPTKTPKPTATQTQTSGGLPIFTFRPPALTAILLKPTAPTNLAQSRSCNEYFQGIIPKWAEAVTLTWQSSNFESGYKVYENGGLVATLSSASTSYHTTLDYDTGTGGPLYDTFGVEAYNGAGSSQRPEVDVPRCP